VPIRLEVVEPAVVDLRLQEEAAVLQADVEREDLAIDGADSDTGRQRACVEDVDAVGEAARR
jgi:hypothetical protein